MTAFLKLELEFPPSDNEYFVPLRGGRGLGPSKKVLEYKARAAIRFRDLTPLWGPVWVSGRIYRPRKQGDFFNRSKALWDSLNGFAYLDDDQIQGVHPDSAGWCWGEDGTGNPRVVLELKAERFATVEEVVASRSDKAMASERARATRNRNRAEKLASRSDPNRPTPGGGEWKARAVQNHVRNAPTVFDLAEQKARGGR